MAVDSRMRSVGVIIVLFLVFFPAWLIETKYLLEIRFHRQYFSAQLFTNSRQSHRLTSCHQSRGSLFTLTTTTTTTTQSKAVLCYIKRPCSYGAPMRNISLLCVLYLSTRKSTNYYYYYHLSM